MVVNVLHVQEQLNSFASSMGFGRTCHLFEVILHLFLLPTTAATIMNHPTHLCWKCQMVQAHCLQTHEEVLLTSFTAFIHMQSSHKATCLWHLVNNDQILCSVALECSAQLSANSITFFFKSVLLFNTVSLRLDEACTVPVHQPFFTRKQHPTRKVTHHLKLRFIHVNFNH